MEIVCQDLESILTHCFGCKKPFLKKPKLLWVDKDGEKHYEYLTKQGAKAYGKLVSAVYGLDLIGAIQDANNVVETLDLIVEERI